jgi:hypothetical protein
VSKTGAPQRGCPASGDVKTRSRAGNVITLLQNWRTHKSCVGTGIVDANCRVVGESSMNLHRSPIVTAIVTVIVTATASIVTPASAQLLTVCASSAQSSAAPQRFPSRKLADALIPLSGRANANHDALIALWQDDEGFDILVNWGARDQRSLRADGAQILGMTPSPDLVHLMVAHSDGGLEHFLFNLDATGSGELLRSLADDVSGSDAESSNAVCVKPR